MDFFGVNNEEKHGSAGAIFAGLGMISQGVGTGIAGASQGTAMCGSKPACISFSPDSSCNKRKQAFQECVQRSLDIAEAQTAQAQQTARLTQQNKTRNTILIVAGVVVAVIIVAIVLTKKKK